MCKLCGQLARAPIAQRLEDALPGVCWRCVHALKDPSFRPEVPRKGMGIWSCSKCLTERFYASSYHGVRLCWKCAGPLAKGGLDRCVHCNKSLSGDSRVHRKKCEGLLANRLARVRVERRTLQSMLGVEQPEPFAKHPAGLLRKLMDDNATMRRALKHHGAT